MAKKLKREMPVLPVKKEASLKKNRKLGMRFLPQTWENLYKIPLGSRSEFIRQAIEEKILHNPQYEKRKQRNGGKYTMVQVPEVMLLALQSVPARDRSEFIRQAVDEKLAKIRGV